MGTDPQLFCGFNLSLHRDQELSLSQFQEAFLQLLAMQHSQEDKAKHLACVQDPTMML